MFLKGRISCRNLAGNVESKFTMTVTFHAAYQNAVREQKLANELSAAKRERDFYMTRVDRAKAEEAKEKRRKVGFSPLVLEPTHNGPNYGGMMHCR